MPNTSKRMKKQIRYTEEEMKVLNDKEYDAIGDQLSIDNWKGVLFVLGIFMIFVAMLFYGASFIGAFIGWIFN